MPTVAVLVSSRLTGLKQIKKPKAEDVVVDDGIDLPLDGSYKWNPEQECFEPLGHGFGQPKPCPVPDTLVLYNVAKALPDPSQEVSDWCDWYEKNMLEAHRELAQVHQKERS